MVTATAMEMLIILTNTTLCKIMTIEKRNLSTILTKTLKDKRKSALSVKVKTGIETETIGPEDTWLIGM